MSLADYNGIADIVDESLLDGFTTTDGITFTVNPTGYYDPDGNGTSNSPHPFVNSLTEITIALVADPFLGEAELTSPFVIHEDQSKSVAPDPYWDVGFFAAIDTRDLVQIESGPPPDVPPGQNPLLVNVCSYPSASPSSDAKDCIVNAGSGFVNRITKTIAESPTNDVTFSWTWGTELPNPTELTFPGGTTELTQSTDAIPVAAGSEFLIESVPSGWQLDAAWASDGSVILVPVIAGSLDMNGDGLIDGADDGFVNDADGTPNVYEVIDGGIDVSGNGTIGNEDDDSSFRTYQVIDGLVYTTDATPLLIDGVNIGGDELDVGAGERVDAFFFNSSSFIPAPAIEIQKTVYAGHDAGASCPGGELVTGLSGDNVTYCLVVTNTGDTGLADVIISDQDLGVNQNVGTLAANGGTTTIFVETTISGDLTNTGAASGNPVDGNGGDIPNIPDASDTDTAVVDQIGPAIEIQKTVYAGHDAGASCPGGELVTGLSGGNVTYCLVVTNTGDTGLADVIISDQDLGVNQNVGTLAANGGTTTIFVETTISGDLTNTGAASGNPVDGNGGDIPNIPDASDTDTAVVDQIGPAIEIQKTVYAGHDAGASCPGGELVTGLSGGNVTYCLVVTNTGDTGLADVIISDQDLGVNQNVGTLAANGGTTTIFVETTISGDLTNTGAASGIPVDGNGGDIPNIPDASDTDTAVVDQIGPAIEIQKTVYAGHDAGASCPGGELVTGLSGDNVTYCLVVTNTGDTGLADVIISDQDLGVNQNVGTLAANGGTTTIFVETTISGDLTNTGAASGNPVDGNGGDIPNIPDASDTDTAVVDQIGPAIEIQKTGTLDTSVAGDISAADLGDVILYSFLVTNSGDAALDNVTVTDPLTGLSTITCEAATTNGLTFIGNGTGTLEANDSVTCTASYTLIQSDIDAGQKDNIATATGEPPAGPNVTGNDPETVEVPQKPSIDLLKSWTGYIDSDNSLTVSVGDTLTYTFDVTNSGNVTLDPVTLSDPKLNIDGTTCGTSSLAPGAKTSCAMMYEVLQSDMDEGGVYNTATVTGQPPLEAPPVQNTDTETVPLSQRPDLTLDKVATPQTYGAVGQAIQYSYTLTNSGNVTLNPPYAVTDNKVATVTCPQSPAALSVGQSIVCTATYTILQSDLDAGSVTNVAQGLAYFTETPVASNKDSETVTATQEPSIALVKTATPNYSTPVQVGDMISYTLVAVNNGNVTLYDVVISDQKLGTLSCVPAQPAVLAPTQALRCEGAYALAQADIDAGKVDNTAFVTSLLPNQEPGPGDQDDLSTPVPSGPSINLNKVFAGYIDADGTKTVSPGDTVTYTFQIKNTGNVTLDPVTLTDAKLGIANVACVQSSLAPGASTACQATYVVQPADLTTGAVENTATATGKPPTGANVTSTDTSTVPIVKLATIGDRVFTDLIPGVTGPAQNDGDGLQNDPRETGIPNAEVRLYNAADDTLVATTTTDANGLYQLTNVIPGEYYLVFITPSPVGIFTQAPPGGDPNVTTKVNPALPLPPGLEGQNAGRTLDFTVTPGENNMTYDAGLAGLTAFGSSGIGDLIWNDLNENGLQDTGEPGLPGVIVELYTAENVLVATTTTDSNGLYTFEALDPGQYKIVVTIPAQFKATAQNVGSNPAINSKIDATGSTGVIDLPGFTQDFQWDAGLIDTTPATAEDPVAEPVALTVQVFLPVVTR